MLTILKEVQDRRRALDIPHMKPQRSKSNILISSYGSTENP